MWWYRGSWLNQQDQMPMIAPSLLSIACLMSTRTVLWMNAWQSIRWLRRKVKALWLQWRNSLRKKWQSTRYGSKWNTEQIRLHFVCAHLSNIGTLYAPQKYIVGMLTNFGSMSLDRIHNTLKVMAQKMVGRHSPYLIYWFFLCFTFWSLFIFFSHFADVLYCRAIVWQVAAAAAKFSFWSSSRWKARNEGWTVLAKEVAAVSILG